MKSGGITDTINNNWNLPVLRNIKKLICRLKLWPLKKALNYGGIAQKPPIFNRHNIND